MRATGDVQAVAIVIVRDEAGRVLLRRSHQGRWVLPGGVVEPGETVEEAARRGVRDETGVVVGRLRLLGIASGPELASALPEGGRAHRVAIAFVPEDWEGLPGGGSAEWRARFFSPSTLPSDVDPSDQPLLARFGSGV